MHTNVFRPHDIASIILYIIATNDIRSLSSESLMACFGTLLTFYYISSVLNVLDNNNLMAFESNLFPLNLFIGSHHSNMIAN